MHMRAQPIQFQPIDLCGMPNSGFRSLGDQIQNPDRLAINQICNRLFALVLCRFPRGQDEGSQGAALGIG